jgi:RNA recognition motif-containing protein
MQRRLYVGNLNFDLTEQGLREVFARLGGVDRVELLRDRWTGISRGFGFVEMMTVEDADIAIAELNGVEVMGRRIRVAPAQPHGSHRSDTVEINR